jgi:predicted RNase H-like HicB family nuclease
MAANLDYASISNLVDSFYKKLDMKSLQEYISVIRPDDNGTFVAYVPAIPSCHAWGRTPDEALRELACVFEMITEEYEEEGRVLPLEVEIMTVSA